MRGGDGAEAEVEVADGDEADSDDAAFFFLVSTTAASAARNRPPSEKLSGVTLITPINSGRRPKCSVWVRSCQLVARCG